MFLQAAAMIANPFTLFLIFIGVLVGIIFGSIPGLSATMALVLFLPMSFGMDPMNGIALLVGLYLGGISGGLISAVLLKIPGTPSSIATVFDGGPMADNGQAGKALGVGIVSSFIGGLISIFALMFISPYLAKVTLMFTSAEYFAVAVFSLTIIASLSGKSLLNGMLAGMFGITLSLAGIAPVDGIARFTFGQSQLYGGFETVVILIGVFAVTDIIQAGFNRNNLVSESEKAPYNLKGFGISVKELISQWVNIVRSSLIGLGIGILPGIGGSTASLFAYASAKNSSKYPEKFGTGIIDGMIASETSNNAVIGGSLIPLITMGIPGNVATAIFLGGLTIHGISPGPLVFMKSGEYIYGIFIALLIANVFMLISERAGLRIFVKLLDIPKYILLPIVMVCCVIGAYYANFRIFDVWTVFVFGFLGISLKQFNIPSTPLIIGFILGTMTEENLRQALMQSGGSWSIFFTRPISLIFLSAAIISVILTYRKKITANKNVSQNVSQ
ncbi:tripartite tricarboxylate transporter permease [Anoxynatronum buryatiense]|uniref:Tricarboxylic transport membrane protein n=1 Tax=Anoxynatronum buryatiense TaxID=489973 RepID=A0AA46AK01_9CLOT|nr:tripartite tricarboxylate transporter permease [Anoxynatronum buryatiense]SMP66172.1 putative tricarboxylic transport membrane protein [Anoxynatronum buryatiense]